MILYDWDIWYVYSSFLNINRVDLEAAGSALVNSGVSVCALHRDGKTWWNTEQGLRSGFTNFELLAQGKVSKFDLKVDGNGKSGLSGYTQQAWYQAGYFRSKELRVSKPPPYVRAVLSEFHLTSSESGFSVVLYPVIKLFESGVILVEFRTMSPEFNTPLEEFINCHVNLGFVNFDEIEVPPAISDLAKKAYYHSVQSWPTHQRSTMNQLEREHSQAVKKKSREVISGDFTAILAPLSREQGQTETLSTLAQTLYSVVGFVISNPRSGLSYLLRGQKHLISAGNFWSGRPHVYITDFKDQKTTSDENIQTYGAEFGWIHKRYYGGQDQVGLINLPKDLRLFNDYSAFISQAVSLWVWSKKGRDRMKPYADANRGYLIYEQQAIIELLEYGYILHRKLLAKTETALSANEVLDLRWEVNHLRAEMAEISNNGEIRDLLLAGWKELGVETLQSRITEGLSIREAQTSIWEARGSERISRWLTILFGVVAVPPIANEVLRPLWLLLKWWQPKNESATTLFFIGIAVLPVVIIITMLSRRGKNREKR